MRDRPPQVARQRRRKAGESGKDGHIAPANPGSPGAELSNAELVDHAARATPAGAEHGKAAWQWSPVPAVTISGRLHAPKGRRGFKNVTRSRPSRYSGRGVGNTRARTTLSITWRQSRSGMIPTKGSPSGPERTSGPTQVKTLRSFQTMRERSSRPRWFATRSGISIEWLGE